MASVPSHPPLARSISQRRTTTMVRWLLYCSFIVIFYLVLRRLGPVLFPAVAAAGVAYLLDGAVDALSARGINRVAVVSGLLIVFLLVIGGIILIAIPLISEELAHLVKEFPNMVARFSAWADAKFGVEVPATWGAYVSSEQFDEVMKGAAGPAAALTAAALGGLLSILGFLAELLLVPVFAFYFLVDWDHMVQKAHNLVPPRHRSLVADVICEIDTAVSSWVRGQLIVTTSLGLCYALVFRLIDVPMGFTIGAIVGLLTIIPFLGTFVGAVLTLAVIALNYSGPGALIGVGVTFIVLHLLEAAVLTPKLVGKKVGLGEVGALFAVLAGGKLLGFTGVLLAVPLAASVAVILQRTLTYYKESDFFLRETSEATPE
ncbi:MAG: AI-2E family transporter [Myxococcales bacterium]|nr:AI-2E family transporter [Myxococcales bacterium]